MVPTNTMSAVRSTALSGLLLTLVLATSVAGQSGSVSGSVYDSIEGGALPNATVYLWQTAHRGVTDAQGRFVIDDVAPGDYTVLFFHEGLGRLGVSPGPRSLTVAEGETATIHLATPSMSTVVRSQCLLEDRPEGTGAVAGRVLDGDSGVPLGGARVSLSWPVDDSAAPRSLELQAGPLGWYRSCAIPADVPVLVSGSFYGRQAERHEIRVDAGGYTEEHLPLDERGSSLISGRLVDNASEKGVEGANVWLRGTSQRVVTDGRGHFQLGEVVPGTYMLMSDHLAYGVKMDTLAVPPDQRLSVEMRLDTRPIPIAPLTVTAEAATASIDRRRGGIVISREQIDGVRQQSRDASDVIRSLHIPGIVVRHNSSTDRVCVGFATGQVAMNHDGCVSMIVFINDVRTTNPELALRMPPDAIERMVVYKPLEAGNLFGLGGGNGVWMIYTRGN